MTATAPPGNQGYGEIFDRGYLHYTGERLARWRSVWALVRYSMARALGFKKGWVSKVIPALLYIGALLPAIVQIGIKAFIPQADILDYGSYFSGIFLLEGIFVATVAPELLCPDRRENTLPLYFSRPITRPGYVIAKLIAAALLTLSISLIPAFILWFGLQLLAGGVFTAMRDNIGDLGRVVVAGAAIAFYLGSIGLLISSFTKRKGVAVGIIIVGFIITESLTLALTSALNVSEQPWSEYLQYLSPTITINQMLLSLWPGSANFAATSSLPGLTTGLVMTGVVLLCCAVMFWRYRENE